MMLLTDVFAGMQSPENIVLLTDTVNAPIKIPLKQPKLKRCWNLLKLLNAFNLFRINYELIKVL